MVQVALFDKSKGHPFHRETDMTAHQDFQVPLPMKTFLSILCFCIEIHCKLMPSAFFNLVITKKTLLH